MSRATRGMGHEGGNQGGISAVDGAEAIAPELSGHCSLGFFFVDSLVFLGFFLVSQKKVKRPKGRRFHRSGLGDQAFELGKS